MTVIRARYMSTTVVEPPHFPRFPRDGDDVFPCRSDKDQIKRERTTRHDRAAAFLCYVPYSVRKNARVPGPPGRIFLSGGGGEGGRVHS